MIQNYKKYVQVMQKAYEYLKSKKGEMVYRPYSRFTTPELSKTDFEQQLYDIWFKVSFSHLFHSCRDDPVTFPILFANDISF